jgi:hypothetical protein
MDFCQIHISFFFIATIHYFDMQLLSPHVFKNEEIIWVKMIETIYYFPHHSFIYVWRNQIQICLKYFHFLENKT